MAVTKSVLYKFLSVKQQEVNKEKLVPLTSLYDELKEAAKLENIMNAGIDLEVASKQFLEILNLSTQINEISNDSWSNIGWGVKREIGRYSTKELIIEKIVAESAYEETDQMRDLRVEIQSVRERIAFQFEQLIAVVKNNSASKSFKLLKEMGFDVSALDVTPKNEVLALKVDSELLGLPEEVAK